MSDTAIFFSPDAQARYATFHPDTVQQPLSRTDVQLRTLLQRERIISEGRLRALDDQQTIINQLKEELKRRDDSQQYRDCQLGASGRNERKERDLGQNFDKPIDDFYSATQTSLRSKLSEMLEDKLSAADFVASLVDGSMPVERLLKLLEAIQKCHKRHLSIQDVNALKLSQQERRNVTLNFLDTIKRLDREVDEVKQALQDSLDTNRDLKMKVIAYQASNKAAEASKKVAATTTCRSPNKRTRVISNLYLPPEPPMRDCVSEGTITDTLFFKETFEDADASQADIKSTHNESAKFSPAEPPVQTEGAKHGRRGGKAVVAGRDGKKGVASAATNDEGSPSALSSAESLKTLRSRRQTRRGAGRSAADVV